jgi:hypothetical protein
MLAALTEGIHVSRKVTDSGVRNSLLQLPTRGKQKRLHGFTRVFDPQRHVRLANDRYKRYGGYYIPVAFVEIWKSDQSEFSWHPPYSYNNKPTSIVRGLVSEVYTFSAGLNN